MSLGEWDAVNRRYVERLDATEIRDLPTFIEQRAATGNGPTLHEVIRKAKPADWKDGYRGFGTLYERLANDD
jgi:hypothetical protein